MFQTQRQKTLKSTQNKDKNYSQLKNDKGEIYQSEPKNVELEKKDSWFVL